MNNSEYITSAIKKVHFIGIGGISMSGLAEILLNDGYFVSGSDMKSSLTTEKLALRGIKIFTQHVASNIIVPDLVVYTAAIKNDNPELTYAREKNITCIDRATLLGEIMRRYEFPIAISGTHGKTTTSSMVSSILIECNADPTVHIGGILPAINDSTRVGGRKYFVTEACEYVESFLKFHPQTGVILNIEADHLDYFRDLEHVKEAFVKFSLNLPVSGKMIVNADDKNILSIIEKISCNVITYGLENQNATWQAKNISFDELGNGSFDVIKNNTFLSRIKLSIPGKHNISNALAAIAICLESLENLDLSTVATALLDFKGARRRFEVKGIVGGVKVVDDYAHHPTEIIATLNAAKESNLSKLFCVFQPHTYTRTKALLNDFSESFYKADTIIVTDIYAARETNPGDINSEMLVDMIKSKGLNAIYISSFDSIVSHLEQSASSGDMIITMGAGNVDVIADMFIERKFSSALL